MKPDTGVSGLLRCHVRILRMKNIVYVWVHSHGPEVPGCRGQAKLQNPLLINAQDSP